MRRRPGGQPDKHPQVQIRSRGRGRCADPEQHLRRGPPAADTGQESPGAAHRLRTVRRHGGPASVQSPEGILRPARKHAAHEETGPLLRCAAVLFTGIEGKNGVPEQQLRRISQPYAGDTPGTTPETGRRLDRRLGRLARPRERHGTGCRKARPLGPVPAERGPASHVRRIYLAPFRPPSRRTEKAVHPGAAGVLLPVRLPARYRHRPPWKTPRSTGPARMSNSSNTPPTGLFPWFRPSAHTF